MGMKEEVMGLAEEVEATVGGCVRCIADKPGGRCLSEDTFECSDAICREVAKRLRAIVEHGAEDVSVSAYDLLPEDEREAIAWVREQGGLDEVEKRLMPEGMEWPKVDGELVDFKTSYVPSLGVLEAVSIYNNGACEVMSHDGIVKNATEIHVFKPKVVDADGVDCRIGDAVWWVRNRTGNFRIVRIEPDGKCAIHNDDVNEPCGMTVPSTELTHKRPVLDADGVEIRAGDEVYKLEDSRPYTVKRIDGDHVYINAGGKALDIWTFPGQLTHEQPDTWERLEEDAEKIACDYFGVDFRCDECPHRLGECTAEARKDLVRRARKLAERGA